MVCVLRFTNVCVVDHRVTMYYPYLSNCCAQHSSHDVCIIFTIILMRRKFNFSLAPIVNLKNEFFFEGKVKKKIKKFKPNGH